MKKASYTEQKSIETIHTKLLQHRWGSIVFFLSEFRPAHGILVEHWDLGEILDGSSRNDNGADIGQEAAASRKKLARQVDHT